MSWVRQGVSQRHNKRRAASDRPIDGEDASAVLRGAPLARARRLYWEFDDFPGFSVAVRDGRWKPMADRAFSRIRPFVLTADRFEVVDRASTERPVLERLLAELRRRHAEVVADLLRPRLVAR